MLMESTAAQVARAALTGAAMRQRVIADNIANVNTPGFLAGRVGFEQALAAAVAAGAPASQARPTVSRSLEPTQLNGNNVNLDHEVISNVDNGLRHELFTRIIDGKAAGLRRVINGQP
ncbi:flagellar basal body protein [Dactylosporangium sp. NPDC005555]|uniref:flagellar basal body rod protein FlgB n=1 Tax=Dactylosporangium sp. NPDC005555 TaxID=3154889 RepID=UPI0033B30ACE